MKDQCKTSQKIILHVPVESDLCILVLQDLCFCFPFPKSYHLDSFSHTGSCLFFGDGKVLHLNVREERLTLNLIGDFYSGGPLDSDLQVGGIFVILVALINIQIKTH